MVEANGTSCALYRLEAGRRFVAHHHPFAELGVVLTGRGRVRLGNESRTLREGDAFYIPPDSLHNFEVDDGPVVMLNVTVPPMPLGSGASPDSIQEIAEDAAGRTPRQESRG